MLVIAPHPDDEVVGCAGTLLLHKQAGDEVRVLFVTDGSNSRALGLNADEMRQRRQEEAQKSVQLLGADEGIWLGLPENQWEVDTLKLALEKILDDFAPHYLYAPSFIDFHPVHHQVAHTIALALERTTSSPPVIRIYPIHVPLPSACVNLVTPTQPLAHQTLPLLKNYTTQWGSLARVPRLWHYASAFYGQKKQAEVFWELSPATYHQLHRTPLPWPTGRFRGIRARPFSDPLAYWISRQAYKTHPKP